MMPTQVPDFGTDGVEDRSSTLAVSFCLRIATTFLSGMTEGNKMADSRIPVTEDPRAIAPRFAQGTVMPDRDAECPCCNFRPSQFPGTNDSDFGKQATFP